MYIVIIMNRGCVTLAKPVIFSSSETFDYYIFVWSLME